MQELNRIGKGAFATLFKVNWLEMEVAKKIFFGSNNEYFKLEVLALPGMFHATIMFLFHCTSSNHGYSIIIELMVKDVISLMWRRKQKLDIDVPFLNFVAIDIILQLSEGMLYLHSKDIVHKDLKLDNILVKVTDEENGYVHFKLVDFGLSKTKKSCCSTQIFNIDTSYYMAPEVIEFDEKESKNHIISSANIQKYPQKSDLYNFGMMYLKY